MELHQLKKLDDYRFLVPRGTKPGMLTDALIFTDERLLQDLLKDLSLEQAINVAMLPGIVGAVARHARHSPGIRISHRRRGGH